MEEINLGDLSERESLVKAVSENPDLNILGLCSLANVSYYNFRKFFPEGMKQLLENVVKFLKESQDIDKEEITKADLAHFRINNLKQTQIHIFRTEGIRLPIKYSEKLAELSGLTIGDGSIWIDRRYEVPVPRHVKFFNKDIRLLNYYRKLTSEVFGIKTKIKRRIIEHSKTNSLSDKTQNLSFLEYCSTTHATLMNMLGVPAGARVLQSYRIPEWIRNGNTEIKKGFVRGLWMCDGCIPHLTRQTKNYNGYQMNYTMWKSKKLSESALRFLNDIKEILEEFGINCSVIRKNEKFTRKDKVITAAFV
ncbi:MAG: hypothetical protein KKB25_00100, partial [Nanoarchaeota archaeon]|nr:hypothetical protein [Nanoarchaeota archaeon]